MVDQAVTAGLGLLCLGAAGQAVAAAPMPVQCSAVGTKFFASAMTEPDACARFARALGPATRTTISLTTVPLRDGLSVELRFGPRGMASAKAICLRAGRPIPLPVYELAISDRQFSASDIDALASDVARGLSAALPEKGKR
jgi:hypothetical protein